MAGIARFGGDISISIDINVDEALALYVEIDEACISQWVQDRLDDARNYFIQNASGPSPSAPGDWPGVRSGALVGSISAEASGRSGTLSAGVGYAGFLTTGTRRMAARKMLPDALDESLSARPEVEQLAQCIKFGGGFRAPGGTVTGRVT